MRYEFFGAEQLANAVRASRWVSVSGAPLVVPVALRLGRSPEGRLVCTGLVVGLETSESGRGQSKEITARALRGIPLGAILSGFAQAQEHAAPAVETSPGNYEIGFATLEELVGALLRTSVTPYRGPGVRPGPKGHPREHFQQVAKAYRDALVTHPAAPMKALASQMHASDATVRRWVQRARDMGLLGPSVPGKAGERPRRRRKERR